MSVTSRHPVVAHPHALRNAWIWVASLPFAFALSMVTGDGLVWMQGYEAGVQGAPSISRTLLGAFPALFVFLLPASLAFSAGIRARREGDELGLFPAVIAGALGGIFLLTNLAGLFIGR